MNECDRNKRGEKRTGADDERQVIYKTRQDKLTRHEQKHFFDHTIDVTEVTVREIFHV